MTQKILYVIVLMLFSSIAYSQKYFTLSGYIREEKSGEALISALIFEEQSSQGVASNDYGFYSLSLPEGEYLIHYLYAGYDSLSRQISLRENVELDIFLKRTDLSIKTVTVTAQKSTSPVASNEFHAQKLSANNIRALPTMFGEADVIKALQLQSGVKTMGDASSGMFVRGGNRDENMILIDEAPVYNPAHLFGLISVFNPDALNHVDFYKSNMPAQFGGRVSSLVNCKMKEGNMYKFKFSASLSPFALTLTTNGPIVKEKASFFVSARKSYVDFILTPSSSIAFVPGFYDLNIKLNTHIGSHDRLFLSIYKGGDKLSSADGFLNKWGNSSATLRWNRQQGNRIFLTTSLIVSDYKNNLEIKDDQRNYQWLTGLNDINVKTNLSYYIRRSNVIKIGIGSIYHRFIPGETVDTLESIPRIQAFESSAYILNDIKIFDWLGINYGLRISMFSNYGKATWWTYDENYLPVEKHTNTSGVYHRSIALEPRISLNIRPRPSYSLKLAYARNTQNMQILQNNLLSFSSLETWFPSNPNIKPIIVDVISAGWFEHIFRDYFFSVEVFYKKYQNQLDYKDFAKLIQNPYVEGEIRHGTARAYGVELNARKQAGRFTANISYSYTRAFRKINGINKNKEYESPYDIPHDVRILANYRISEKWSVSSGWLYMSGRPITLPIGFYEYQGTAVPIYTHRNSTRLPDYHRLDLSFTYDSDKGEDKVNWLINFGIFNLYAHENPLGYDFSYMSNVHELLVYQYSLFTILPNFSVKMRF